MITRYIATFAEGATSFLSPCVLPMIPVFLLYFGADNEKEKKGSLIIRLIFFIIGFTLVFVALGVFAGSFGNLIRDNKKLISIVSGVLLILLGMIFAGLIKNPLYNLNIGMKNTNNKKGIIASFIMGIMFSINFSPCIGPMLGAALVTASEAGSPTHGGALLLSYSIGLGIPFLLSGILAGKLSNLINKIKQNTTIINQIAGILIIIMGIYMLAKPYV